VNVWSPISDPNLVERTMNLGPVLAFCAIVYPRITLVPYGLRPSTVTVIPVPALREALTVPVNGSMRPTPVIVTVPDVPT
jgi:hypothetical protein